ncbi:tRNA pseudouridine(38-40) synthase TruA [Campylobacter sp. MIT 99-7217]|uniref:tRNA pseudouridine(38-40) synthase TruA n=1 Tax=Campylobacter sp. MIT 99-7217 TaxID=535091 RepID=UPI00115AB7C2|nr:tRNA pseudouridine(38-40) synthase TruA [Campylobacter sp. MIT 99-7217]TQR34525.1 tRNA pseudouridine(38-40) synthase TruA [Campylobacter sp. MIT 99-7217]
MRLKLVFSYDGSSFEGSATQPHKNSVQDYLQEVLGHVGIFEKPLFASRTDKGVHALKAVAQVDCGDHFKDFDYLKNTLNKFAKPHLYIKNIQKIPSNFEVRFEAKARQYYYVLNHANFSPFLAKYYHFYPKIDIAKANELLSYFEGQKDFLLFSKLLEKNKTSVRTMFEARAFEYKNLSIFKFKANGFLRAQIRMSVDFVLKILQGKLSKEDLLLQLNAQKSFSRTLAPASGLYLSKIFYP